MALSRYQTYPGISMGFSTGLGLSITNDMVKAHGGQITISDGNETGTVFKITLP